MKKITFFIAMSFLLSCNDSQKIDTKAESEKIMQLSKDWSEAASSKDLEKTLSYWAEDAVLISAGEPTLTGKEEIRQMVQESFKTPGFKINWQPISVKVSESGDIAYMIENSQITYNDSTGKPIIITNKAVSIWHKQKDGNWKNAVDISTPAAQTNK